MNDTKNPKNPEEPKKSNKSFKERFLIMFPVLSIIGLLVGILGGYIYYLKVGCVDGTCAITSNPWLSMVWGGVMGYLLFDMFSKKKKNIQESDEK
jgi:hypothetical protein